MPPPGQSPYFIATAPDRQGRLRLHALACKWMPNSQHRRFVGYYRNPEDALDAVKDRFHTAQLCDHCSPSESRREESSERGMD